MRHEMARSRSGEFEMADRMIIEIDMGNAAFDENASGEMARILRDLADRLDNGIPDRTNVFDINGNRIGYAALIKKGI